jgi:membrane protein YdbS with pleckstrin-like domain
MTIKETHSEIVASIWRAIAQSKVDLTGVPQEQRDELVNRIADNVLVTMNNLLDQEKAAPVVELDDADEKILWQGRPFLSLVESYVLTNERLKIVHGLLSRDIENFELIRVQDIDVSLNVSDRILGIGDIVIKGADPSSPEVVIRNIKDPQEVYEILRRAWLEARKKHGLQFREFM